MELVLTPQAFLVALGIFFLRVMDMSLDTIRVLMVVRGRRKVAWILGFLQSAIFVVAITSVLTHVNNPLNVIGYAAGFATGNVVGMMIEDRLAIGHKLLTIISPMRGSAVADQLRGAGYGVTEISGRGKDGMVTMLHTSVFRKDMDHVETIILEADPQAFVTSEDVRPVRRGHWRA